MFVNKAEELFLKELTDARGVPGNEDEVRDIFKKYAEPHADKLLFDGLGGIMARQKS